MSEITRSTRAAGRPFMGRPAVSLRIVLGVAIAALMVFAAPARADQTPPAAVAQNVSIRIQALWQVQQACVRYCYGTSQTQTAVQTATTIQIAIAIAADPGTASATNSSTTVQVVVQLQLGCVAFCYGTTQTQSATQDAATTQVASAVSAAALDAATAANSASIQQAVWQLQQSCRLECHDAGSTQTASEPGGPYGTLPPPPLVADAAGFRAWLTALAATMAAATVDLVEQYDVAACLEHCEGGALHQAGRQDDVTVQVVVAVPTAASESASPAGPGASDAGLQSTSGSGAEPETGSGAELQALPVAPATTGLTSPPRGRPAQTRRRWRFHFHTDHGPDSYASKRPFPVPFRKAVLRRPNSHKDDVRFIRRYRATAGRRLGLRASR